MPNPNVQQGTLNRIRGSAQFSDNQGLNAISSNLGRDGISIAFDSEAGASIGTMTGTVTSPDAYQMATITFHFLKTQAYGDLWKQQIQTTVNVGDFVVRPDAATLSDYQFQNGVILGGDPGAQNGTSPDYVVRIRAAYQVNSALFDV